jgi:hypothetical protein
MVDIVLPKAVAQLQKKPEIIQASKTGTNLPPPVEYTVRSKEFTGLASRGIAEVLLALVAAALTLILLAATVAIRRRHRLALGQIQIRHVRATRSLLSCRPDCLCQGPSLSTKAHSTCSHPGFLGPTYAGLTPSIILNPHFWTLTQPLSSGDGMQTHLTVGG